MPRFPNPPPGAVLREEFAAALSLTPARPAHDLRLSLTQVAGLLRGRRRVTADTALRLARYFGN